VPGLFKYCAAQSYPTKELSSAMLGAKTQGKKASRSWEQKKQPERMKEKDCIVSIGSIEENERRTKYSNPSSISSDLPANARGR
jgi:hypothetical protein